MFIKLHGVLDNERILINVYSIEAIQELKTSSKYYEKAGEKGAKTIIKVGDKPIAVKETLVQITHMLKGVQLIGGPAYEIQDS